jgi:hypothetical protein
METGGFMQESVEAEIGRFGEVKEKDEHRGTENTEGHREKESMG